MTRGRAPVPTEQEAGWASWPIWTLQKREISLASVRNSTMTPDIQPGARLLDMPDVEQQMSLC
jgi:hypothetical protein